MMSCREVCEKAQDFTDGEVSSLTRAKIRLHLLMCRNCAGFMDQTRQTSILVQSALKRQKTSAVTPELLAELRKRQK